MDCELKLPPAASDVQLLSVHSRDYVEKIIHGKLSPLEERRIGFPWSPEMVERSRRSTGATIAAGRSALRDSVACNLAGGTHHAFSDNGQGYCVFNDVCVAIKSLQGEGLIQSAIVIDCDVHQGNGTASIAAHDESIFAMSIHCEKNYPFQKTNGDLDVALPPGTNDDAYLAALATHASPLFNKINPDIVFYLAGADPFQGDRLGLLSLTKQGLKQRDEFVISSCRSRQIPLAICMAGGYAPDVEDIVDIHFSTVANAYQHFSKGPFHPESGR